MHEPMQELGVVASTHSAIEVGHRYTGRGKFYWTWLHIKHLIAESGEEGDRRTARSTCMGPSRCNYCMHRFVGSGSLQSVVQ